MRNQFERTELLVGRSAVDRLGSNSVIIFGLGGVGGQLVEALARAGVGRFLLVDFDRVDLSNINRQIFALHSTVGRLKTEVARERILDINPAATVETAPIFVDEYSIKTLDFSRFDYVADAVDTVAAKVEIIKAARAAGKRVISCMGAGGRLCTDFQVTDIAATHSCPLAKKMRNLLKKQQIERVNVVFSPSPLYKPDEAMAENVEQKENSASGGEPAENSVDFDENGQLMPKKRPIGSISFVPPIAGLVMAGHIIKEIVSIHC